MATVKDVVNIMERLFPPCNVCMRDSIGLMAGSMSARADKIMVCLDCTEAVADEAVQNGVDLIITHHPLIFGSITSVTDSDPVGRVLQKVIGSGISVFSAHTNMDCSKGGINEYLAEVLGLEIICPLESVNENASLGTVGRLREELSTRSLGAFVSEKLHDPHIKTYVEGVHSTVAVINGSGGSIEYIDKAMQAGATCLVTAEIKHHVALYAVGMNFSLVEFGHYSSERIFVPRLARLLAENIEKENLKIEVTVSECESDPAL